MKKKNEIELLADINNALDSNITESEREYLLAARNGLEKKQYLPKITSNLRNSLTPLAMRRNLSKDLSGLYLKLNRGQYANKRFGGGIIMNNGQF